MRSVSTSSGEEKTHYSRKRTSGESRSRKRYRSHSRDRHDDRGRYRSRSTSRRRHRSKYSRSPSHQRNRSCSKSPESARKCLGVFGLSSITTEDKIKDIFSRFGPIERTQLIMDAKTGRSRGFCFVYFQNANDARVAKDNCTGLDIDNKRIRVDYSLTHRPHTPTPGVYMGKVNGRYTDRDREPSRSYSRRDDYYEYDSYKTKYLERRSPSPYRNGSKRYRSRSRSYSSRSRHHY